eukprot:gene3131-3599_t
MAYPAPGGYPGGGYPGGGYPGGGYPGQPAPGGFPPPPGGYGYPPGYASDPLYQYFATVAGADQQIDCVELQRCLTQSGIAGTYQPFSLETCRIMISMLDRDYSGKMGFNEFKELWGVLNQWKNTFFQYDADRSGTVEPHELHNAIRSWGYNLTPQALNIIVKRYSMDSRITFDNFIAVAVRLRLLTVTPKVELSVSPDRNWRENKPIQVNVTCTGRFYSTDSAQELRVWLVKNSTKVQEKIYSCNNYLTCPYTLRFDEASFGNEAKILVHCLAITDAQRCSEVSRNITLLDGSPPTTILPTTEAIAEELIGSSSLDTPLQFTTAEIVSMSIGSAAFLCIIIVSVYIRRRLKQKDRPGIVDFQEPEPIPPPDFNEASAENRLSFPVYPFADDEEDFPPNENDEFSIGPGMTLTIPKMPQVLGNGSFGVVVLGTMESCIDDKAEEPYPVAVKMLKDFENPRHKKDFEKEIDSLKNLEHPNIVRLIATFASSVRFYIIMEYLSKGNLLNLLHNEREQGNYEQPNPNLKMLYKFVYGIASGMEYLANNQKIHRDLAARNILVSEDYTAKIADFGLARNIAELGQYITTQCYIPWKWVAPEALETKSFSVKTDVWSFGVVVWEILTLGDEPYSFISDSMSHQPVSTLRQYLQEGGRLEKPDLCSDKAYDVIKSCWAKDQLDRPTFSELKNWAKSLAE